MSVRRYDIVLCRDERQHMTLEALASRAGLHPGLVERYIEFGLIEPIDWEGERLLFDPSCIPRLRMIGRLRTSLGINLTGIGVILDLLEKIHALKLENEILRGRI
jgi:DNA-binding transcriptional MerR regulator